MKKRPGLVHFFLKNIYQFDYIQGMQLHAIDHVYTPISTLQTKLGSDWTCGHSYKYFTLVNYDSRVVPDWKIPHITTLES